PEEIPIPTLKITQATEDRQVDRLRKRKAVRNARKVTRALERLARAAETGAYLMPLVIDAVRAQATVGEISDVFRSVYGEYREGAPF
ncbi:MAG TPA: methylmalonyl-CoA mutase family protein, partial [Nitrospiria bacterium]|nr:methylmalonyl-CoA mutase family protein [Nitrospiria bacterium]